MSTASSSAQSSLTEAAYANFPTSVAILDETGVIVDVNLAWRTFGERNGAPMDADNVGDNYLAACDAAAATDDDAAAVAAGLRTLLAAEQDVFTFEYECSSPEQVRWFLMHAVRFTFEEKAHILISHLDVTDRKLAELDIAEVNERLSTLTTLLSSEMSTAASLAVGRLSLLESEVESDHLTPLQTSLKSLQDDITELLTIVRGEVTHKLDGLDLESLAGHVWAQTFTQEGTLEVTSTATVRANADQLSRLLNHLYRVALLRGGVNVVVTVSPTDDGFVVEHPWPEAPDDVDPMAAAMDEQWLDSDLSIVELLAAAHGWLFEATVEGETARYRIAGADILP